MEPKLPSPERGPNFQANSPAPSGESRPSHLDFESAPGRSVEQAEQRSEAPTTGGGASSVSVVLPAPVLVSPATNDDNSQVTILDNDLPAVAGDSEVIEKEWVNKAKKVIAETKDDPYRREQEVNKLQADYLLKRYGRKLGSPN